MHKVKEKGGKKPQKTTPTCISGCCGRSCFWGGNTCSADCKEENRKWIEAPRATVPLWGGAERTWSSWGKWKYRMNPELCLLGCRIRLQCLPAEPVALERMSPLSQLGDSFPAVLTFLRVAGPVVPIHSPAEVLHHPQVSPDLLVPWDATSPSCSWSCQDVTLQWHSQCLCAQLSNPEKSKPALNFPYWTCLLSKHNIWI